MWPDTSVIISDNYDTVEQLTTVVSPYENNSVIPIGVHTMTYTTTDRAGNAASCSFVVTVTDSTPPVPICPEDFEAGTLPSTPYGIASWSTIDVVENDVRGVTLTTIGPSSGSALFALGDNAITIEATDPSGNKGSCNFTVTIVGELMCLCFMFIFMFFRYSF